MAVETKRARIHGFDIIRLISFFVVALYHFIYAIFHGQEDSFYQYAVPNFIFGNFLHYFERGLASSGHILLFLSMILVAIAKKSFKQILRFSIFLIVAWLLFVWADNGFATLVAAWDIHPLLFVGLLSIVAAETLAPRSVLVLGAVGFALTWIRFYDWPSLVHLNLYARSVLIGDCEYGVSSWPILPWIGFLWWGYAIGFLLRSDRVRERSKHMGSVEFGIWIALLAASMPLVGAYLRIPMEDWECKAFRLNPLEFYSDFVWVLFAIRLSLLTKCDVWLGRRFAWISRLNVSKNFFLAYALQYALAFLVALFFRESIRTNGWAFVIVGLLMLPAAELIAYLATRAGARKVFKG